jgi:hypothetical protein
MEARKLNAGFGTEKSLAFERTLAQSEDMYIVALKDVHQDELKRVLFAMKKSPA